MKHDKPDFKELERMWDEAAKKKSYCSHRSSRTVKDENGVYHFYCPDCGLVGMGNYQTAVKLGWFL